MSPLGASPGFVETSGWRSLGRWSITATPAPVPFRKNTNVSRAARVCPLEDRRSLPGTPTIFRTIA